ncbi:HlyD family type I secretion periplasmic adaptor subunit [Silicimonas sp. MF1-12-2]|uniref:HlyD family type I secretion periplasmic adaptor subunit n=1 Tax=Silicimonas sp. MF1-12-2 TaxID=3384793 RepID=UPI0039B5E64C
MSKQPSYSGTMPLTIGFLALALLVGGVGVWSVRTEISGAIIAPGMIVLENNRQVVQHPEGGIVERIEARDGDQVKAGDLLIQLDDTLLRSELAVAELQLIELRARRGRLEAERDQADDIRFPDELLALDSEQARAQIEGQRVLFVARKETLEKELSQLVERTLQTRNQIEGAEAQLAALNTQEELASEELVVQEDALSRGLTQSGRVSTLRREAAQLQGQIGQLRSDIARFRGEIASFEIEAVRLQNARREAAISELRDIQFRELELTEQRGSLLKRLDRLDIRAPVAGIVYGSTVFAQNSVVRSAEPLLYIIPQDQPLIVNSRVEAIHIDQVHVGQAATLRFSAFNQRLTPEVTGQVTSVSADVFQDEVTGLTYYRVDLIPLEEELPKLADQSLLPGMPVEAYLKTENRTPLSYLTKPLTDYFGRAFRES